MNKNMTDLLIIGAGPVGLFAGFYAGMRNLSVRIIDSLPEVGGQPQALYPDKPIYDIPAYPKITGRQLTNSLMDQLARFKETTTIHLDEKVIEVHKESDHFQVVTSKDTYKTGAVILAAGNGAFKPRKIQIDGLDLYEENNISYAVSNFHHYKGKKVAVAGGGDSAFDAVIGLSEFADQVYLIHRRDKFRAHEYSVSQAQSKNNVSFLTPYIPKELTGDGSQLTGISLAKARSGEVLNIDVDHLFMTYGFVSSLDEIKDWSLDIENESVNVDRNLSTNIEGFYAIGDIVEYPFKAKLIATGFGEAPHVINQVAHYLYPERRISPLHSTSMFSD